MKLWMWIVGYGILIGLGVLIAYIRYRLFDETEKTQEAMRQAIRNTEEYIETQDEFRRLIHKEPGQRGS